METRARCEACGSDRLVETSYASTVCEMCGGLQDHDTDAIFFKLSCTIAQRNKLYPVEAV